MKTKTILRVAKLFLFCYNKYNMKDDALSIITGNPLRAKLVRLFILEKDVCFHPEDLRINLKATQKDLNKELKSLERDGVIKSKKDYELLEDRKGKTKRVAFTGYIFNRKFLYRAILENLVIQTIPITNRSFVKEISTTVGPLELFVTGGIFSRNARTNADILIVGDSINEERLNKIIKELEKIVGKELRYMAFNTNEFAYRYNINDKLIRDILDNSPQIHIDNIGVN